LILPGGLAGLERKAKPDMKCCIGIDLGGTFIKFGLTDTGHRPVCKLQLPTPIQDGPEAVIAQMARGSRQTLEAAGIDPGQVVGVGIGSPGPLSLREGTILATPNLPGMNGFPIRRKLAQALGLPVTLENDANAAALGEYVAGAGRDVEDLVMLTLGTGLGSGIVLGGKIIHGSSEMGGELGHLIVEPGGEQCGCGQRGCLERYCSATYLARHAMERLEAGAGTGGELERRWKEKSVVDGRDINEARKLGDPLAAQVWDRGAYYLALGCVNVCRMLDPSRIVIGGGLVKAGEDLMAPVREHFAHQHWTQTKIRTEITAASLGNDAGLIGAAAVAWQMLGGPMDRERIEGRA
jgi:glucokinase